MSTENKNEETGSSVQPTETNIGQYSEIEEEILSLVTGLGDDMLKVYQESVQQLFAPLVEKYGLEKEKFQKILESHFNDMNELIDTKLNYELDKEEIQTKWLKALETDSKLFQRPEFLTELTPVREAHLNQLKETKAKITETRDLAISKLDNQLKYLQTQPVRRKTNQVMEQTLELHTKLSQAPEE